jgi:hypothetical protein
VRRCAGTTVEGLPCQAIPMTGSLYCVNHDPDYAAQQAENRRKGGLTRALEAKPTGIVLKLLTTPDRMVSAERIINDMLAGKVDRGRTATTLQGIATMQAAFGPAVLEAQIRQLREELAALEAEGGQDSRVSHTVAPGAAQAQEEREG